MSAEDKISSNVPLPEPVDEATGKVIDIHSKKVDEAAQFLAECGEYPPMTPEMEKKIIQKIDRWMIPMLMFYATLGAVDKVEMGTAALYGFRSDNHLVGQDYSWLGSILSIGMLVGVFPSSYLVHRLPAAKYMAFCCFVWSCLTLFHAACHNYAGLMTLRFLMGMFEAITTPGLSLMIVAFWKKNEQPLRNGIILSAFSSVINGFWSWVIGNIPDSAPLAKWQYLYLLTGSINICYSIFLWFAMPSSPIDAHFLTHEERYYAVQRLAENRTGVVNKVWKWDQALEAVLDIKTWLILLFNIAINIPNGGLITFGSIIINNLGFDPQTSALLSMPNGVMSTISACAFGYMAIKWENRRVATTVVAAMVPLIGVVLVYAVPRSNVGVQMFGLYLMYCYWGPYCVGVSLPQANCAGHTKKTVTYGMLLLGYAAGNLIGPQTFRSNQAPGYTGGVIGMLCCYCACMGLVTIYGLICFFENRARDKKYGNVGTIHDENLEEVIGEFQDKTDKQQPRFRYIT